MAAAGRPPPRERYQKLAKVGEGSCGVVFKCRDVESGSIVAVKKVRFSYESDEKGAGSSVFGVPASALREVAILRAAEGHPNVVQIRDAFLDKSARIFIVCEYLDLDLRRYMEESGRPHQRRTKLYAWQILCGLRHCHSLRIAHRDVKPGNILVDPRSDGVKLCDFSLGRRLLLSTEAQTRRVASLWYRSPEVLLGGEPEGMMLDLWSTGCVVGEMLGGEPVFPGGSEIETLFLQFRLLGTPDEASWPGLSALPHWSQKFPRFATPAGGLQCVGNAGAAAAHLLGALLRACPTRRLSADSAMSHAYFGDLDSSAHAAPLGVEVTERVHPPESPHPREAGAGAVGEAAAPSGRKRARS